MEPGNFASLGQRQEQRQQLSARKLQSLELLHLPRQELEARLGRELEANPVLEEVAPEEPLMDAMPPSSGAEPEDEARLEERGAEADEWNDELPLPVSSVTAPPDDGGDCLSNSPAPPPSLGELLARELATSGAPPRERELALAIIAALDENGYLATPLADLAMSCGAELEEVERALKLVQSFDPPGVGARNLAEALRLQLERSGRLTELLEKLLAFHLDDIARNKLPQVARKLRVSLEELRSALAVLRSLNPTPGAELATAETAYVEPELEISRDRDGGFSVRLLRDRRRRVVISERYLRMLENPELDAETRNYVRERVQRARELLQALEHRGSTLEKLGEVIVATQKDFLEHGVKELHPLTMKQAGEMMHVDESVVSRAAADKLVITPQGVFPCRFFFSGGFPSGGGESRGDASDAGHSSRAVMERIREIIASENPSRPYSDDAIAGILRQEGVPVARRTVAKYRDALRIPSSGLRRRH